jgi:hypothetical protein
MKEKKLNEFYENLWSMAIKSSDVIEEDLEENYDKIDVLKRVYGTELLGMIADEEDLQYIETTDSANGYPSHISGAIIGFDDIDHFNRIMEEYSLNTIQVHKRDGWQLWCRYNYNGICDAFELTEEDYGVNYNFWYYTDADRAFECFKNLIEDEMNTIYRDCRRMENIDEFDDIFNKMEELKNKQDFMRDIICAIKDLPEDTNHVVITNDYDIVECCANIKCMSYSLDTHNYANGLTL